MKATQKIPLLFLLVIMVLSACAQRPAAQQGTPSPAVSISTLQELESGLKASGATVERGEVMQDSFFPVAGQVLTVNGATLTAWEFADEAAREAAASTISGGGFIIGTSAVDWIDQPNFFSQGRLIVLYVGRDQAMVDLLSRLLGPQINQQPPAGGMDPANLPPYALMARSALAQKLGIPEDDIVYITAEAVEWPNSCLGLAQPDEMCAEVITPGYNITFEARGASYEVHTDESGSFVRIKG